MHIAKEANINGNVRQMALVRLNAATRQMEGTRNVNGNREKDRILSQIASHERNKGNRKQHVLECENLPLLN